MQWKGLVIDMKKFTKVSLIVVAVIAAVGIIFCGIAAAMGAGLGTVYHMAKSGEFDFGNWEFENGITWTGERATNGTDIIKAFDASEIQKVSLEISAAYVNVKTDADASQVTVRMLDGEANRFESYVKDKELTIKYKTKAHQNDSATIEVTFPANMEFEKFNAEIGASDMDIEDADFVTKEMTVSLGAGDFTADYLHVTGDFTMDAGAGDIDVLSGDFQNVQVDAGVGDASLTGTVRGNIKGSCGVGSLSFYLTGKESDFNYDLQCGLGEIDINDSTYSNLGGKKTIQNDGAAKTVSLDCGVGDVSLETGEDE